MSTQQDPSNPQRLPPRKWIGRLLLIGGATILGMFITKQLMDAGTGRSYFGFIVFGGVLLSFGLIISIRGRNCQ